MSERDFSVALAILCGGKSKRFGRNKCDAPWGERTLLDEMIHRFEHLLDAFFLVSRRDRAPLRQGVTHYFDLLDVASSMNGIYSAISQSPCPQTIILPCDMPFVPKELILWLADRDPNYDVVVPRTVKGLQPLCARYSKSCLPSMKKQLDAGDQVIYHFYPQVNCFYVDESQLCAFGDMERIFLNINTKMDMARAKKYEDCCSES